MLQSDVVPTTVRLSDEDATRSFFALREESHGWKALIEQIGLDFVSTRGYSFDQGALMILGFEDDAARAKAGQAICKSHGAFDLGHGVAERVAARSLRDAVPARRAAGSRYPR